MLLANRTPAAKPAAMASADENLAILARGPSANFAAFLQASAQALQQDQAAAAEVALLAATTAAPGDPRLWQHLGLARRALQDSAGAHQAFAHAARLLPQDPLIAHSLARTALEAGYPALESFNRARLLAPQDGSVALGRIAALLAQGLGQQGCEQLAASLAQSPGWTEGHIALARLIAQVDPEQPIGASLRKAVAAFPAAGALWKTLFQVLTEARDYPAVISAVDEARTALGPSEELDRIEAVCRSELGEAVAAQALFDHLPFPADGEAAVWPIRNFIRLGRYDEACLLAEQHFDGHGETALWPYRALLWRLLGDERWHWLEGDPRLIQTYDLTAELDPIAELADVLRGLHRSHGAPLDQSVRGGTQTDGNLLARAEPEIRRLRAALLNAAQDYVAKLPPPDPAHPMLLAQRAPLNVAGSWSVRLAGQGFHTDHVHQQGWISSACYLVVPPDDPEIPEGGWLAFGECRSLLPQFKAFRTEAPRPGKLVLFPSIMWHGTRAFGSGERMTAAFDIARPAQG